MCRTVYKTLFWHSFISSPPKDGHGQESGLGVGAARCNHQLLDGWTLTIWTMRENFILQGFHVASMSLALRVREQEHFQGRFQSGREVKGRPEGSYTSSRVCCMPCDQSREQGGGLRRARAPFSLFSTQAILQCKAVSVPPGFKPLSGCPLL